MTCRAEASHLSRLYETYKEKGLMVLGINATNDPKSMVEKIAEDLKLKLPILLNGSDVAVTRYAVRQFPSNFMLAADGRVLEYWSGYNARGLEEKIQKLFK